MQTLNDFTNREVLEKRYKGARDNIMLIVLFTIVNVVLLILKSDTYFLFSASIPYFLTDLGMILCGMYDVEYYGELFSDYQLFPKSAFAVFLIIVLVILSLYFLSWLFSKKNRVGWLIFALVIFALDTAVMLLVSGLLIDSLIDIAFHIWIIVSLSMGIAAGSKLKKMPSCETVFTENEQVEGYAEEPENSQGIRAADFNAKSRVFIECDALGYKVIYRRVNKIDELVIGTMVYAEEKPALFETAHSIKATLDGHLIEAGYDGATHNFLKIDGQTVKRTLRLY